jgi:hypothetical protein|tara:strand:- start:545 stop:772 length:228 start_codon:yes stop_codon:yes gene_type:complete
MLTRKFNKKEKIILKMYVNYILKKKIFKKIKKSVLYRVYSKKNIVLTNKLLLETILNKKYFNNDIRQTFKSYSIQ